MRIDGLEAMQLFDKWRREDPSHINNDHMLLVGMSANAILSEQDEAFHAGMHIFLSKPIYEPCLDWMITEKKKHQKNRDLMIELSNQYYNEWDGNKMFQKSCLIQASTSEVGKSVLRHSNSSTREYCRKSSKIKSRILVRFYSWLRIMMQRSSNS